VSWLTELFASGRLTFLWPWLALLLPLPWILRAAVPPARGRDEAALRVPFGDTLRALVGDRRAGAAPAGGARSARSSAGRCSWLRPCGPSCSRNNNPRRSRAAT
jgi:Ca-activated chloride channel family protein